MVLMNAMQNVLKTTLQLGRRPLYTSQYLTGKYSSIAQLHTFASAFHAPSATRPNLETHTFNNCVIFSIVTHWRTPAAFGWQPFGTDSLSPDKEVSLNEFKQDQETANTSKETLDRISQILSAHRVVVFMKGTPDEPECGFSAQVMRIFDAVQLYEFAFVNVLEVPDLREGIKAYSNWPTIPQVFVNGEFVGGCDILIEMYKEKTLKPFLMENNAYDSQ